MEERHRIFFWMGIVGIAIFGMYVHKVLQSLHLRPSAAGHRKTFTTKRPVEALGATALMGEGNVGFYQMGSDAEHSTHVEPSLTSSLDHRPRTKRQPSFEFETADKILQVVDEQPFEGTADVVRLSPSKTTLPETEKVEIRESSSAYTHQDVSMPTANYAPAEQAANPTTDAATLGHTRTLPSLVEECYDDMLQGMKRVCRLRCPPDSRTFSLPGMVNCHPWLSCTEIARDVQAESIIGEGSVKQVHVGRWQNYSVAVNKLKDWRYLDDFTAGLGVLMDLSGNPSVVQLIGVCLDANVFVTELHPFGNVLHFARFLQTHPEHRALNSVDVSFKFCISYAEIVTFVHNSPIGTRVMCDTNELGKVHHQLLVTNGWQLVLNDVDAMPLVNGTTDVRVVCGSQELRGSFVAPEQRWPYADRPFARSDQPPYDEKVDIWKMPDVCDYFLGDDGSAEAIKYHLFAIHKRCKSPNPFERPAAAEVLLAYNSVYDKLR